MILGPDKKKLSKRHGAQSVMEYQKMGYLPQAVVNYLVRLGWSYGDQEEFAQKELIEKFTLEAVGKSAAAINPGKLDWLNAQYMKRMDRDALAREVLPFLRSKGYLTHEPTAQETELLKKAVQSLRERAKTLVEMADLSEFYFSQEITYEEKASEKFLRPDVVPVYEEIITALMSVGILTKEGCHRLIQELAERRGEPLVKIAQPLRVALTGKTVSPPMDEVMDALGKEEVIRRLQKAIQFIQMQNGK
jgi:glutamyl-tRNA synthetase